MPRLGPARGPPARRAAADPGRALGARRDGDRHDVGDLAAVVETGVARRRRRRRRARRSRGGAGRRARPTTWARAQASWGNSSRSRAPRAGDVVPAGLTDWSRARRGQRHPAPRSSARPAGAGSAARPASRRTGSQPAQRHAREPARVDVERPPSGEREQVGEEHRAPARGGQGAQVGRQSPGRSTAGSVRRTAAPSGPRGVARPVDLLAPRVGGDEHLAGRRGPTVDRRERLARR